MVKSETRVHSEIDKGTASVPRGASGLERKDQYSNKTLNEVAGAKDGDETDDIKQDQGKNGLTFLVYADARPKD